MKNVNNALETHKKEYQPPIILAFLLLLIGVSVAIHQFKVPPIMMQVAESTGLSAENAPMLMSVFILVCLIFAVPAGSLVERMQAKSVLILAAAIVVGGSILGAISDASAILLFSRGVEGLGFLIISIAIPVAAVTHTDPKKIGMVMGICGIWISVGSILAFNTVPVLSLRIEWQGIWWIYAIFTIAAVILFIFTFRSQGTTKGDMADRGDAAKSKLAGEKGDITGTGIERSKKGLRDAVKNRNLIFASIGFMVYNFNLMSMITFFPVFATTAGLMEIGKASFIASLPMILSLAGSPLFGRLADIFGHKWLYFLSLLCCGIGVSLMFIKSMPIIIIGACILGLIGATTPALMFSSLGKLVPSGELIAQSNGIVVLFQNAGMFLASLLFGVIAKSMGGNFTRAAMFLIPMTIVSVILVFFTDYKETAKAK